MGIYTYFKAAVTNVKLMKKRHSWNKNENIWLDQSVMIFPETSISARTGLIKIGAKSCIRGALEIQRDGVKIEIGEKCYVGDHTRIWAADTIKIGNSVLIAHNVNIFDNDTHPTDIFERREDADGIIWNEVRKNFNSMKSSPIEIDDDTWIGC